MALPEFSMRQLLEAGVHFGHQTQRWNPRMGPYIYGARNGIHIMDLTQTVPMLDDALKVIRDTVAKGGSVLFVGNTSMALPEFSMRQLLEAGVHFGHQTQRWNPRMGPFIYGARNGIHIMDLTQTVPMLDQALQVIRDTVAKGGSILFVGTKRQAAQPIAEAAEKCAQYYMNHRWLGGTLTNWQTVSKSIQRLKSIDEQSERGFSGLTKKERLGMERDQAKLEASLGGIREMGGRPDLIFVIDVKKEALA
eukprot:CAMPEP_0184475878 /NCGR_PEP_ID=MMETSP0740-20130409/146797_1 /TAXON_ID=385413 /ORGANISM="Thalassiosira miniscula, Strain CCMP1093" /LENGTH=249 /DNA_ID=CAMNT_0026853423 /DNA_START=135 /DNA_END=881 /DNA_ORIENTATION=-